MHTRIVQNGSNSQREICDIARSRQQEFSFALMMTRLGGGGGVTHKEPERRRHSRGEESNSSATCHTCMGKRIDAKGRWKNAADGHRCHFSATHLNSAPPFSFLLLLLLLFLLVFWGGSSRLRKTKEMNSELMAVNRRGKSSTFPFSWHSVVKKQIEAPIGKEPAALVRLGKRGD